MYIDFGVRNSAALTAACGRAAIAHGHSQHSLLHPLASKRTKNTTPMRCNVVTGFLHKFVDLINISHFFVAKEKIELNFFNALLLRNLMLFRHIGIVSQSASVPIGESAKVAAA